MPELHHGYAAKSQVLGLERIKHGRFSMPTSHLKDGWREVQSLANFSTDVKKKAQESAQSGRYGFASSYALSL